MQDISMGKNKSLFLEITWKYETCKMKENAILIYNFW